jgi:(2R)-ethylmalonyl-CoA mutase
MGGAVAAIESGYMKSQLVASHALRRARVESGEDVIVGVNKFTSTEPSPLVGEDSIQVVDPNVEIQAQQRLGQWKADRDESAVSAALDNLRTVASSEANLMEASLACARVGVTTGEWAGALRDTFGEFRAPTGVAAVVGVAPAGDELTAVREAVASTGAELGVRLRMLVGKPGLDGHSNGAEQIAVRARDAGFEVVYQGIRLTPEQIVAAAVAEDVDVVGLSILSGSHLELVPMVLEGLRTAGMEEVPVVVGGIIPDTDAASLKELGVAAVFTPKDYDATVIMSKVLDEIRSARGLSRLRAG